MIDILFSVVLFILSLFLIFVSKVIMYKVFKCDNYKKNLYISSLIITLISFIMFVSLTYLISRGNGFELYYNLSSFSLVYMVSLVISIIINCVLENNIYKNKKYVYGKKTNKKS